MRWSENPFRHNQTGQFSIRKGYRLDLPQNEDVAVREQQTGCCTLLRCVVDTLASNEPLTSECDASQGVRVSQVVGSLQKTTQHGWKDGKCWPMLKNVFHRSTLQLIRSISYGAIEPSKTNGLLSFSLKISANSSIRVLTTLSTIGALWYTCLKPSCSPSDLNVL